TVTTNERSGLTISKLLGDGSDGTIDNKLKPGEYIAHVDIRPPLEGEHAGYHRVISRTYAEWPLVEAVVPWFWWASASNSFALQQVVSRQFRCASSTSRRHCGPRLLK